MVNTARRFLNDSPVARWAALLLVSSMMFFAYMFIEVLSPLQNMLLTDMRWDAETYGLFGGSEYFLNVFFAFLIFAGIILDKMGVRFTGILSAMMMILGAAVKLYALTDHFAGGGFGHEFLGSFWKSIPASAKMASIGFAIFGAGVEMAGITVSRIIVKWFSGKELAMAMGIEMAIARLGVFAVFRLSPKLYSIIPESLVRPVAICGILLCVGLISFIVFAIMDRKLDSQIEAADEKAGVEPSKEEQFKISDIGKLLTSKPFMLIAMLCVLYYSAIFPFQKFATSMLENSLNIPTQEAAALFSWFPIGAMVLTPLLGAFLDHRGKGASMLIVGAILMFTCHTILAVVPLTKIVAYAAIIILGVSFSLVPAALWPSVPKLVEERYLGSAYGLIFWIQNIGLLAFPIIIGWALNYSNPDVVKYLEQQAAMEAKTELVTGAVAKGSVASNIAEFEEEALEAVVATAEVVAEDVKETAEAVKGSSEEGVVAEEGREIVAIEGVVGEDGKVIYDYTFPMLIFASLGILALIFGVWLKREDHKHQYGLELPNIK